MTRYIEPLAAAAATCAAFSSAFAAVPAGDDVEVRRYAVRYADLDLATTAGRQTLDRRISAAVERVCGSAEMRDLAAMAAVRQCRHAALKGAQPQLAQIMGRQPMALAMRGATMPIKTAALESSH